MSPLPCRTFFPYRPWSRHNALRGRVARQPPVAPRDRPGRFFGPDQCGIEGSLIGTQILGNAKCPLGDARILGIDGLGHVVVQGNVVTIALASEFGAQQTEDGFFTERAVNLGLFRNRSAVFDRRRTVRRNGCQGLAAAEEDKSEEQRGRSIHIGKRTTNLRSDHHDTSLQPNITARPIYPHGQSP